MRQQSPPPASPVTRKVHFPAPASLMTLQVYSPRPSRFRLRTVYSVSSRWASKAPACSSRLDSSHSKRSTREGWARSTRQLMTTGLPRPWRISRKTGSTVGGSERDTETFHQDARGSENKEDREREGDNEDSLGVQVKRWPGRSLPRDKESAGDNSSIWDRTADARAENSGN